MGEAKRRKELGIQPRKKEFKKPEFNKEKIQKQVRETLYKYPIIPYLFYGAGIIILLLGIFTISSFKFFYSLRNATLYKFYIMARVY